MKDQIRNCDERLGIHAAAIYSMQDEQDCKVSKTVVILWCILRPKLC